MYFYFPKEELKNCPKGFNLLPIRKSETDDSKYRTDLSLTPFHDYERDVIRISSKEYIDTSKALELTSYLLLRCGDDWLTIDSEVLGEKKQRIGLLEELVNRGEEQRVYSYNFNSIKTGLESGDKAIVVLGYIVTDDKVIFVNRFDFPQMPSFINKNNKFVPIKYKDLFSKEFLDSPDLDELSKFVATNIRDVLSE